MNVTFLQSKPWAAESPIAVVEGESITFTCTFWGDVSNVSAVAYRNNTEVTSTVFPAGSISTSDSNATLKPATGLVGGARYVIAITATVGGDTYVRKIELICSKDELEQ